MKKMDTGRGRSRLRRIPDPDMLYRRLGTAVIAFHEAVARQSGLGISEHKCLGALLELGTATAGRLARETGFTTGAITGIVDRLERAGLVVRRPNPKDRRSVLIRPANPSRHRRRVHPLFQPLTKAMARLRRDFTKDEMAAVADYLQRTTEILKQETLRLETPQAVRARKAPSPAHGRRREAKPVAAKE